MNAKDIGWLAGVLDGEGCIHASKPWKKESEENRLNGGRNHFHIRVIISNGSQILLEKVGKILREANIVYKFHEGSGRHVSDITFTVKSEIRKFLELVVDDLTCKKRSAELVIKYLIKWPESKAEGWKGSPPEKVQDYIRLYNILKKQKVRSPLTVETTRYASEVDEDIVRYSQ